MLFKKKLIPFISIITSIFCYLPIILKYNLNNLSNHENNEIFVRIILGSFSSSFPLLLDVIMNFDLPKEFVTSRGLFLCSLFIPNLIILTNSHGNDVDVDLVICSNYSRQILVIGGLINCLSSKNKYLEMIKNAFFLSACSVMIIASNYFFSSKKEQHNSFICILIFGAISFLGAISYSIVYIWQIYNTKRPLTSVEKYSGVLAFLLLMNHLIRIVFQFPMAHFSIANASEKAFIDSFSAILGFILPSRIAIEEAAISKVTIIS